MKKILIAALLAGTVTGAAQAATLANSPDGSSISSFGANGASLTYGQVFTAPVTGKLTSFTLNLNGGVGALFGGVGTWNGTAAYGAGYGSPTNLYQSATVASTGAGAYTFLSDVSVTQGSLYVAYLSVFGVAGANSSTSMPLAAAASGINYFVWNNYNDPRGNTSWNYFADFGSAQFSATFGAVPEPATWGMMALGFGMAGATLRTRRRTLAAA